MNWYKTYTKYYLKLMPALIMLVAMFATVSTVQANNPPVGGKYMIIKDGHYVEVESVVSACDNVTNGGEICCNESQGNSYDPAPITNVTAASGGTGALEYQWLFTVNPNNTNFATWQMIPANQGGQNADYDPGTISTTTYYVRCARRAGCTDFIKESNIVIKAVSACANIIDGGKIASNQIGCGATYDPAPINSILAATGGTGTIEYAWYSSTTTPVFNVTTWTKLSGTGASYDPAVISQTTYYVRVARRAGCSMWIPSNSISVTMKPAPIVTYTTASPTCFGGNNGGIDLTVTNGTPPYSYVWNYAGIATNTQDPSGLASGSYSVTVADQFSCMVMLTIPVTAPAPIAPNITTTNVYCNGQADGKATATATGGTAPYNFAWSNGQTGATATGLSAQTYTVTVTDANGCQKIANITLTEPAALSIVTTSTNPLCNGDANGKANVVASGGTAPYTYIWSNGQTSANATGLAAGTYTVLVTDARGCTKTGSVNISDPTLLTISATKTDVKCFGGATGSATATATGGTGTLSFTWSNGQSGATINNIGIGTYTVTVKDANGCTKTTLITVAQPTELKLTANSTNVKCNGASNGTATASAVGGTAPYTFKWSNGDTNQNLTGLAPGTYGVTVTDANGCVKSQSVTVTQPNELVVLTSNSNVKCNGGSNASATVAVSGGTTPYTIKWSNGQFGTNITNLTAGTYVVTVTDANGCVKTGQVTVTQPDVLSMTTTSSNIKCKGQANGSAEALVTGGTAPYSYVWSNSAITSSIANLPSGTYTVIVTDANGCTTTASVTITEPSFLLAAASSTNVSCNGGNNGTATAVATGGTAPYTYAWSNGGSSSSLTGLTAGNYTVTIQDANGCTKTASTTISQPTAISITSSFTNVQCDAGNSGTAKVTVSGGTAPYTYLWSNAATTSSVTGLAAGTYTVTVTDAKGCIKTAAFTILSPSALQVTVTTENVKCNGGNDGKAVVAVTGGTAPYTYLWSNGAAVSNPNLPAGTFTVTVTDANGCSKSVAITIEQPTALSAAATSTNVSCYEGADGTANATATGGTAPYVFTWSNGKSGAVIGGLAAGTYTVTATDANGCTKSASVIITQPTKLNAVVSGVNLNCYGNNGGKVSVAITGGTTPYTIAWSNGQSGTSLIGLNAGTYTATVTDANGCTSMSTITITQPDPLKITATNTNVACNGGANGSAVAVVTGGTAPYAVTWSNGQNGLAIANLAAGTYTANVTDANGCTASVSVTVSEADQLSVLALSTNLKCFGDNSGTASVNATGGTVPYTIKWNTGAGSGTITNLAPGTYTVTVTDAKGCNAVGTTTVTQPAKLGVALTPTNIKCNGTFTGSVSATTTGGTAPYSYLWNNGATSSSLSGVAAGSYSVTVIDGNGCSTTDNVTITQPNALTVAVSGTNLKCNGNGAGEAFAAPVGGVSPYFYQWSNGGKTSKITGLSAGTYTMTLTDANGCTATGSVTITEPTPLVVSATSTDLKCSNDNSGTASSTAVGGTAPYTITWSNGATTPNISGLGSGVYTVTVKDANGCTKSASVTIAQPTPVVAVVSYTDLKCKGDASGSATVVASGGTAPYSIKWSTGSTASNLTGLGAGTYSATVTDANGCTATASATIKEPTALSASASAKSTKCNNSNDGSASASAAGGTAPYSFAWSNGTTGANLTNLAAGTYKVTVTDANGCTASASTTVSQPATLTVNVTTVNVACNGGNNGSASATVAGGTAPYTYKWSNGQTGATATALTSGTYTVTITDANGCFTVGGGTITQAGSLVVTATNTNILCNGAATGTATAIANGGTAPYSFKWSNSQTGNTATGLVAGSYTVTVTDAKGCFDIKLVTVTQPTPVTLLVTPTNIKCNGDNSGKATTTVGGGTAPYTYIWTNGQTGANAVNLGAGTFGVTVTDANGCTIAGSVTLLEPSPLTISMDGINIKCNGGASGVATVSSAGGTAPYSYLWSNGGTTQSISSLTAGTYGVTVTDAAGCKRTTSVTITQPSALDLTVTSTNATCNGASNGTLSASTNGGTAPYAYLWSTGDAGALVGNLTPGTYTVTVTDGNGCTAVKTGTIAQPSAIVLNLTKVDVSCNSYTNGSTTASATGGVAPYTYVWSNGQTGATNAGIAAGTYTVTVTDATGCSKVASIVVDQPTPFIVDIYGSNIGCFGTAAGTVKVTILTTGVGTITYAWSNGSTSNFQGGLVAGTYTVTVTNGLGCQTVKSITLTQPTQLTATAVGKATACSTQNNGTATVTANGGAAPYSYTWSNGQTSQTAVGLAPGTYTVVVKDNNGCTVAATATVVQPAPLVCSAAIVTNITKYQGNDGKAAASATGGTTPYSFKWSNGQTTPNLTGATPGIYTVTITDANGCSCSSSVTFMAPSKVGDFVWNDINGNGIQDQGEPGIPGVQITLTGTKTDGTPVSMQTTTDANGAYVFDGLMPGTYKMTYVSAANFTPTVPNAGLSDATDSDMDPNTNMSPTFNLGQNENNPTIDAGFVRTVKLGDYVWFDTNKNGQQDATEAGVKDITVKLWKQGAGANGGLGVVQTTITDANGMYMFRVMPGMTYAVQFDKGTIPNGYEFTAQNAGPDATDSDADVNTGITQTITVPFGNLQQDDLTFDAGIKESCINITDGGIIGPKTSSQCGPGVAAQINDVIAPTGGAGAIEYLWLQSTTTSVYTPGSGAWTAIPNSNSPNLNPGFITQSTWYVRCARRAGCPSYPGEANVAERLVDVAPVANITTAPTGPVCKLNMSAFAAADAGPGATYSWDFGPSAIPQSSTLQNTTAMWNSAGTKLVKLTVTRGACNSMATVNVTVLDCSPTSLVQIIDLTATPVDNKEVSLTWETENPTLDQHFIIERSKDGKKFETIGTLDPSTVSVLPYKFMDNTPHRGAGYYRIKHVENAGKVAYSPERRAVIKQGVKEMMVYPNPFVDHVTVEVLNASKKDASIEIVDTYGRIVKTIPVAAGTLRQDVDLSDLPSAFYVIKINFEGFKTEVYKINKISE